MTTQVLSLLDWFLPPAERLASPERRRQGRVLVAFSLGFAVTTVTALVFIDSPPPSLLVLDLVVTGGYLAAVTVYRLGGSATIAALLTCSSCFACFAFVGVHHDGLLATIHPFNLVVPLLAVYIGGTRMGIGFTAALVVEVITLLAMQHFGLLLPSSIMPQNSEFTLIAVGVMAVPLVALLSALHRSATESAERALGKSLADLAQREAELRAKEIRYRELFESMNDAVAVYEAVDSGRDFIFKEINQACSHIERIDRETVLDRRVTELFPGVEAFGLLDTLRRVFSTGKAEHLDARLYEDERISGWRENFVYRLPTMEVVAIYRDVTAEKVAQENIESAFATTEQIIDAAPFALVVVDASMTIQRANGVACAILGAKSGDLVGQPWSRFVPCSGCAEDTTGGMHETEVLDVSEHPTPVLLSVIPVTIEGRELLIEAFVDLTERKRLEGQFRHAQKLESVGQLAAGVAHEINNPLGVILGFAQGLERRTPEGDPLRLPVTSIVREAIRCKSLVHELLVFSRTGKTGAEPVDLNELIGSTKVLIEARAKTQNVIVSTELTSGPATVIGNKTQLQQVLVNLGNNALDAMPTGGELTLRTVNGQAGAVILEIADNGAGIPEEIRSRIFEPFFTTKEVGKGTGLGLGLVWEIVQQHSGAIDVMSTVGKGTTMRVRLPTEARSAEGSP